MFLSLLGLSISFSLFASVLVFSHHFLLSDNQYGFRRSMSTDDILSYLTDFWSSSLGNMEKRVVAVDISKAFDRVWYASLLWVSSFSLLTYD